MDASRRLAEVRIEAGAEACMEAFGHMVMATASPGMGLEEWPVQILSAQTRAWRTQQAQLDIWAHAMKATADVFTEEGVHQGRAVAPVSGHVATGHFIERRVSAEVINFAERRKLQPIGMSAESRGSDNSGVSARLTPSGAEESNLALSPQRAICSACWGSRCVGPSRP